MNQPDNYFDFLGYRFKLSKSGRMMKLINPRLRSILRKRIGLRGRGRGADHQRWPNRYFTEIGLFSLEAALKTELASLRNVSSRR